jgi:hypothetical protein
LHPVTIRPSSTKPATPTGKFEYGAYAFDIALLAAARNSSQLISTSDDLPCDMERHQQLVDEDSVTQ